MRLFEKTITLVTIVRTPYGIETYVNRNGLQNIDVSHKRLIKAFIEGVQTEVK